MWFALFPSTLLFLVRYSFHVAAEPGWNTTTSLPTPCVLRHTHATTAYLVYVFDAVPPSRMAFPHGTFALRDSVDANWQRSDTKPSKKKYTRRHGVTVLRLCRLPSTLSASSNTACCTPRLPTTVSGKNMQAPERSSDSKHQPKKKKNCARDVPVPRVCRLPSSLIGYSNTACCTPRLSTTVSGTHFQAPEHMFR